jgi:DNA-binding MarR family transcriptional regulator
MASPRFSKVTVEHSLLETALPGAAELPLEAKLSGEPEQEVFINLLRSYDCLWSEQGRFIQRFGITPQQYNVLNVLALRDEGHGVACQEIAENLLNRVPDITRLLDRLEQAGLILRERCCSDRRVVRTHLTDVGRAKVDEVRTPLLAALKLRFAHMSEQEVSELNRLLHKLREPGCPNARAAFDKVIESAPPASSP